MTNQELYKQAILDAKAVRETALAAARESLAEAFEPRLKEMVRLSISEEEAVTRDDNAEKAGRKVAKDIEWDEKHGKFNEASDMEETALDEILAELDELSNSDKDLEEAKVTTTAGYSEKAHVAKGQTGYDEKAKVSRGGSGYDEKAKSSIHEAEEDEEEDVDIDADGEDMDVQAGAAEGGDQQEVVDITVGDLKDIIRDVFMTLQGGAGEEMDSLGSQDQEVADDEMEASDADDEISLEEILAELEEESKMEEAAEVPGSIKTAASDSHKVEEMRKDLEEATRAVKAMKYELNEVNLLNAKLLYVNKIFKAKSLNESQKVKVLNAFDRATSIKEVENTYKTLNESIGEASKKSSLKESVGFASKPIGSAPARPIVETDIHVSRWQQLAGIK